MSVEIALGVSEANDQQLALAQDIMARGEHLAIHADHADGSVHPRFARDAFSTFKIIEGECLGPCDIHLYIRHLDSIISAVSRFADEVPGHRAIHLALESVDDIYSAQAVWEWSRSLELQFVPTIQTDPLDDAKCDILDKLLGMGGIDRISILMPSSRFQADEAGRAVVDLYNRLLERQETVLPKLCLDRNCSPVRVQQVAQHLEVSAVTCGSFLWSAIDVKKAILELRASAS